ncbi:exosporium glycoprotein BclB-related protein [Lysinibacillus irui]|uniref:exosporium glycoprotein BclB-related protein n=1 Tax=Lysinibacillus irui TaxID=2998077 RepID=UPI002AD40AFA|nr:exosporium glycoprotein BclB-related protein [Lysinibacillus irui]MEA0565687.1 exosporium glycoprotein BclB-related protein [Lysinibacillus irui]
MPVDGSIIPFSSGISLSVIEDILGAISGSMLGFGSALNAVPIIGNTINLTNLFTEAFSVPREGKITAISATFAPIDGAILDGSVTIRAQIFLAPEGSNIFTGTSASVDLIPPITGPNPSGQITFASANIPPVPVSAGDQLLMVFYISSVSGVVLVDVIVGNASAGINIV